MLVLKRRVDQEVVIRVPGREEPVIIKVIDVYRASVRLGFAAGGDVKILRKELEG